MTKLTKLEMNNLQDIAADLEAIKNSYYANVDSVQDFLCKQFTVTTDEPEVLNVCIKHFELTTNKLYQIQNKMDLLVDHFITK